MDTGYCGLVNQGATCYLNTVLQTFFMTPEFRDAVHKYSGPDKDEENNLLLQLNKLFLKLEDGKHEVKTTGVTRSLGMTCRDVWVQQDVAEFFRKILNEVSNESPVSENYQSTVINATKCLKCETEASDNSRYLDIPLPLNTSDHSTNIAYSVENGLRDFLKSELLEGDNQSYCDKCEMKTDTETRYYFQCLPRILTLQLKRFQFNYYQMSFVKIQCPVEIPLELRFQKAPTENTEWCLSATIPQSMPQQKLYESSKIKKEMAPADIWKYMLKMKRSRHGGHSDSVTSSKKNGKKSCSKATDIKKKVSLKMKTRSRQKLNKLHTIQEIAIATSKSQESLRYELFAICDHSGGYKGGHYTARIKSFENSKWYTFNDSFVQEYLMEQVTGFRQSVMKEKVPCISSSTAYLLMYRKSEASKPDNNNTVNGNQRDTSSTESVNGNQWDPSSTESVNGNQGDPSSTEYLNGNQWDPSSTESVNGNQWDPSSTESVNGNQWDPSSTESVNANQGDPSSTESLNGNQGDPSSTESVNANQRDPNSTESVNGNQWDPSSTESVNGNQWDPSSTESVNANQRDPNSTESVNGNQWDPSSTESVNANQRDPGSTKSVNVNQRDPSSTESVNANQRDPGSTKSVNGNQWDPSSTESVSGNQRDPSSTESPKEGFPDEDQNWNAGFQGDLHARPILERRGMGGEEEEGCKDIDRPQQLDPSGHCCQERSSSSQFRWQGSDDGYTWRSGAAVVCGGGGQSTGQRRAAALHLPAGGRPIASRDERSTAGRPTTPALLMELKPDDKKIMIGNQRDSRSTENPIEGFPDEDWKWDVPAILGKKTDGSWCLRVDFSKINPVTTKVSYLLHRISEALDYIFGSCWFSELVGSLNLRSGDSEVQLSLEFCPKTMVSIDREFWQFQMKLFGEFTFECLVKRVHVSGTRTRCVIYLDDLEVHTPKF
ncbi:UBP47 hydrolase, partial [Polyodon spathula]|nr:UBP47 hydrolase [Polyodon spathula]